MGGGFSMEYQFKREDAFEFSRFTGNPAYYPNGNELVFKFCPICRGGEHRDQNTFAINLTTGAYNCKRESCGAKGSFRQLAYRFGMSLGKDVDDFYYPQPKMIIKKFKAPEKDLSDPAKEYLKGRGISEAVMEKYEVKSSEGNEHQIAFVCKDTKGEIRAIKYRAMPGYGWKDGSKEKFETSSDTSVLYGISQCNLNNKTLIITEGQIDTLSVAEAGFENVVSVIGGCQNSKWVNAQWEWFHNFNEMIVFGDHEKGRVTLYDDIKGIKFLDVKKVRDEDYLDCKDANDILQKYGKEQITKCIKNAELPPVHHVKRLADVEPLNLNQIKKLKTAFPAIDKALHGGLPFGGVTIITGKTGEGKSTLANQICANAIAEGIPTFIYSGELMNKIFKSWFYFQIAGPAYLNEDHGDTLLDMSYFRMIDDWCGDNVIIYDNEIIENDDEQGSLLQTMNEVQLRNKAKVFLIDNLMTAMDLDMTPGTDEYNKQSNFMKRLTAFAIRNDALVILIAHKRKNSINDNENDEVAGSSNITNLAMVTLGFRKPTDKEMEEHCMTENQRMMSIAKNRLFGTTIKGIEVSYDWKSRRLYTSDEELYRQYGWAKKAAESLSSAANEGFITTDMDFERIEE